MNAALMIMVQNLNAQLAKAPVVEEKKRKVSDYNKYVKKRIAMLKEKNPTLPHTEIFKRAVADWETSEEKKESDRKRAEKGDKNVIKKAAAQAKAKGKAKK
jgi:hypothetical protein